MTKVAIFLDVPNICFGHKIPETLINWGLLSTAIASTLPEDADIIWSGAYVQAPEQEAYITEKVRLYFQPYLGQNFDPIVRSGKDVDTWIVNDMHGVFWRELQELLVTAGTGKSDDEDRRITLPVQCHFILVSGDGGYLRTINTLRQNASEIVAVTFDVWSWSDCMNQRLSIVANRTFRLDDYLPDYLGSIETP